VISSRQPSAISHQLSRRSHDVLLALAGYFVLTIVFTWPIVTGLMHDVPGDLGDPVLNTWIVAWGASHLGRGWWSANIFFPHPLALAYSEHLLPQALQVLPIHLVSRNPLLSYNVIFLSTFVLSGLGTYLFVRELTGRRGAAFVAGVAYAFAPYRATSIPHLQVLSSQWMPFALYGVRRFLNSTERTHRTAHTEEEHGSGRSAGAALNTLPLWGAAAAWLLQNLSCGYYLLFFSPVVIAYIVWELSVRSLWTWRRVVVPVFAACAAVLVVTALFMLPYLELRRLGFNPRSLEETTKFSADTYAYLTADPNLTVWGAIVQAWPRPEGALFPGFVIVALALVVAVNAGLKPCATSSVAQLATSPVAQPATSRVAQPATSRVAQLFRAANLPTLALFASIALVAALAFGWTLRLPVLKIASFSRAVAVLAVGWTVVLAVSASIRRAFGRWLAAPAGFFTLVTIFAMVMSWGPSIHAKSRLVSSSNLYAVFYDWAPGFDGVRAPARFAMIVTLALAVLGGLAVAAVATRIRSALVPAVIAAAIFVEGVAFPIPINQNAVDYRQPGLAPLPGSVAEVPAIYSAVAHLPASATLVELPLGEPAFDVRYMLFSTTHWRPLVNGYSGGAPRDYEHLDFSLQNALERPDAAWQALAATGASHAIVHEAYYAGSRGARISEWLRSRGAQEIGAAGADRIFRIR
jgi:hypothetical protein